jgi:CubicO group peptidase (beta-lactamase class C family)
VRIIRRIGKYLNLIINNISLSGGIYFMSKMQDEMKEFIRAAIKKTKTVGLSIALVDDQKTVWAQGFGYQDKARKLPATESTVYQVGSITKLFTVLATMQLVEQGKLDIDQPLQRYIPDFSIKSRFIDSPPITARTIMTHHSGIPSDHLRGFSSEAAYTELIQNLQNEFVAYPPNYIFSYSNTAFSILGHIVEKVSGNDYVDYVNEKLLQVIGMRDSFIADKPQTCNPLFSKSYKKGKEDLIYPLRDVPAGGLYANVKDMALFMQMIFAGGSVNGQQVIAPETINETLKPQNKEIALDFDFRIGLGWWLSNKRISGYSVDVAEHGGSYNQFHSQMMILPEYKLGVIISANSMESFALVREIAIKTLELALVEKSIDTSHKFGNNIELCQQSKSGIQDLSKYIGYYAAAGSLGQLFCKNESFFFKVKYASLRLKANADNSQSLKAYWFGIIPFTPNKLKDIKISFDTANGHDVIMIEQNGLKLVIGEKIMALPLLDGWNELKGSYRIVNRKDLPYMMPEKIAVQTKNGFLTVEYKIMGNKVQSIILPVSATEGIIAGLGRGARDTITIKTINGTQHAIYSGLEFKKIK